MSLSLDPCLPLGTLDGAWERLQKDLPSISLGKKNELQIVVVGDKNVILPQLETLGIAIKEVRPAGLQ